MGGEGIFIKKPFGMVLKETVPIYAEIIYVFM